MTTALNRFAGPMPKLRRIYASDLALPSDPDWLRDNPKAADADVDACNALTALGGLALPDLTELPTHWRAQFQIVRTDKAAHQTEVN